MVTSRPDAPDPDGGTVRGPRAPTTAGERWAELMALSHDGVATLSVDGRFEYVSGRAAVALGRPVVELVDRRLRDVVPELSADQVAALAAANESDESIRVEIVRAAGVAAGHALQLVFVPRRRDGRPSGTIMLTHDVTDLRAAQRARREAQRRLMAVEEDEHRRISREIHDGPVQLLAALALRLGAMPVELAGAELDSLETAVIAAGSELRSLLVGSEPAAYDDPAAAIARWSAPLLADSALQLDIDDHTVDPPNRATIEALFVLLHESLIGARTVPVPRRLHLTLSQRDGGYEMTLEGPHRDGEQVTELAARFRAVRRFALRLGGTFALEAPADDRRVARAWLPCLDAPADAPPPLGDHPPPPVDPDVVGVPTGDRLPVLTDDDRTRMAKASHEGLLEFDAGLRITDANDAYSRAIGRPIADLIGTAFPSVLRPVDWHGLRPAVERVLAGETVRFEWKRSNAAGEQRWTQVAAAPRFDDDGGFRGAIMTMVDTTDLHFAEALRDEVQTSLERATREARRLLVRQLDSGPLDHLTTVYERLSTIVASGHDDELALVRDAVGRSIAELRASVRELADLDPAATDPAATDPDGPGPDDDPDPETAPVTP